MAETVPVLGSFSMILLLLLYIFTVLAVQLFSVIDLQSTAEGLDREMGYHVNFQTFPQAFITLFRCATGEAWNSIMFETSWGRSILHQCTPDETYETIIAAGRDPTDWQGPQGCGSRFTSFLFFSLFQLLFSQIYLNLIIAIIVDAFSGVIASRKMNPIDDDMID